MIDWLIQIQNLMRDEVACVLISVLRTRGSSPSSEGNKMLYYTLDKQNYHLWGSIGGGMVEHQVCGHAKALLEKHYPLRNYHLEHETYPLHPESGQCCGGEVQISYEIISHQEHLAERQYWIEDLMNAYHAQQEIFLLSLSINGAFIKQAYTTNHHSSAIASLHKLMSDGEELNAELSHKLAKQIEDSAKREHTFFLYDEHAQISMIIERMNYHEVQTVVLFGCGHIARHLVPMISPLAVKIYWVDNRAEEFELFRQSHHRQDLPCNVHIICQDFLSVDIPPHAYCLVITYSHEIDYAICKHVLSTSEPIYLGLISSKIKEKRFKKFLQTEDGVSNSMIDKLKCPIGKVYKTQKSPGAIAISIANHLLETLDENTTSTT